MGLDFPLPCGRRPSWAALLVVAGLIVGLFAFFGHRSWQDSSAECVRCHGDQGRLTGLNAAWAYVSEEAMRRESRHPYILCRDCHLGDGRAKDKNAAHRGMLKMLLVGEDGGLRERVSHYPYGLSRTGPERVFSLLPKKEENGQWLYYPVRNILWHDRDPASLNFDPALAAKTCGKAGCHPEELKQFRTTTMASNHRQRFMKSWLEPYGPHNCGPSFADLPPAEVLGKAGLAYENTARIAAEMTLPVSRRQAEVKQKLCNVCHVGCLDCHYQPGEGKGMHNLVRQPAAESCAGFGRGTSMCHAGAMHSRRGGTYLGGDYSVPAGMAADRHHQKGLDCLACHPTGPKGMGDLERKADCQDCHLEVEETLATSVHRKLACAACHIAELTGYQITVWGPGLVGGEQNPFHKYLYYGSQKPPLLMKDQAGVWQAMKVWPNTLANVRPEVAASGRFLFRWPKGETGDAYAVLGTVNIGDSDRHLPVSEHGVHEVSGHRVPQDVVSDDPLHLPWLEAEKASHPFGRARDCSSCHEHEKQRLTSRWEFADDQGAEPFSGSYRIVADGRGLRLEGMQSLTPIRPQKGYKITDFAPWQYFPPAIWRVPGDFAIRAEKEKYRRELAAFAAAQQRYPALPPELRAGDKRQDKKYRAQRNRALHNPSGENRP